MRFSRNEQNARLGEPRSIDKDNNKQHWHYDKATSRFKESPPVIS
ncbi:MAG: hypothetical protein OEW84_08255 [Aigarchaeota archaeon]|nr:hypothetical protein [Aigarchaeota archaeon]